MKRQFNKLRGNKRAIIGSFTVDFWVIVGISALLMLYIATCFFINKTNGTSSGIKFDKEPEQTEILGRILNIKPFVNYVFSYNGLFLEKQTENYLKKLIQDYGSGSLTIIKGNEYIHCIKIGVLDVKCESKEYKTDEKKNKVYGLRSGNYFDFYFPGFKITNVDETTLVSGKSGYPLNALGGTS